MKLFVVRHGQTVWNKEKKMQGSGDSSLTELGILEARKLGEAIRNIEFDRIYTSPLGRTLQTTEFIRGDRDIPVQIIDELQEMNFGIIEGKELSLVEEKYGDMINNLWNNPVDYRNDSGENFEDVYKRVGVAMDKITSNGDREENVLVITHGVIISVLFSWINGGSIEDTWKTPVVKNTSISILESNGRGEIKVISKDDTSHLE